MNRAHVAVGKNIKNVVETMSNKIKLGDPLEKGFDRVVEYCFQPFEFAKWITMGFVAWVLTLGENGFGSGFNFLTGDFSSFPSKIAMGQTKSISSDIKSFINDQLTPEVITIGIIIAIVIMLIILTIWLVIIWIKAKFQFIFLDNIVCNRFKIKQPWKDFNQQGSSLFKWNILFGVLSGIIVTSLVLLGLGITLKMCWSSIEAEKLLPEGKSGLIIGGVFIFLTIITTIVLSIVSFVVKKLLVPIMYKEKVTITQAWRKFRPAFSQNKGNIALFIIVYWIVVMAVGSIAGIAMFIIMILTCFFFCLGFIPFIGGFLTATLMLPVTIFYRMLSYEYAMQFQLDNKADIEIIETDTLEETDSFNPKTI